MDHRIRVLSVLALASAVAVSAAVATPVTPHRLRAASGRTQATVAYYAWPSDFGRPLPKIEIRRRGRMQLIERVPPALSERKPYRAIPFALGSSPLRIVDLDGDGEPEVLLSLYWAGTRCCMWTRIYRFDRLRGRYVASVAFWGNFQDFFRLRDLDRDGRPELVARDGRIESISSTYDYFSPVRIFSYRDGRLVDVTRRYRQAVERDARWLHGRGRWTRELLSAWVADEYLLGRRALARREVQRALRRGELAVPRYWHAPSPEAYVHQLYRFLRNAGYE